MTYQYDDLSRRGTNWPVAIVLAVIVDDVEHSGNLIAFRLRKLGPPDVEDQNEPVKRAVVPCLMLDAVIKGDDLALFPLNRRSTHTKATVWRDD